MEILLKSPFVENLFSSFRKYVNEKSFLISNQNFHQESLNRSYFVLLHIIICEAQPNLMTIYGFH